jgi:hypothetical protein
LDPIAIRRLLTFVSMLKRVVVTSSGLGAAGPAALGRLGAAVGFTGLPV